ncbi:S-adenosyl-L-methionine-dependent tRNA 4-demethylwyosine synthase TYW1 [Frankliniella fusca]|uniref:S-adenosyl-L-methionine-dependent tRNA 4-demethylwyosine synthase TYW1 n=1 Tax=Frankliniella fusca TaxID=407009 RepID=A0AAE1LH45_9NEOP|nr:S-adenosyl-L-methionine-dependent tRNA 4-demethylwyosine synthase TYW1 [Frankliniella fusca]
MSALFGAPIYGTLSVPLAVGAATIIFLWMFVFSKKTLQSSVSRDELQKPSTSFLEEKVEPPQKKKKRCGSKGGCWGIMDGKSGSCSDRNKAIEIAKVFIDTDSIISQEFATVLLNQMGAADLSTELIRDANAESIDLSHHVDGSLCIFLTDVSNLKEDKHWLQNSIFSLTNGEKPLIGMKYSVFMFQKFPSDKSKVEALDQLLHKSGAIRLCKAESTDLTSAITSSNFDDWAEELLSQVQRWNTPKKPACKCSQKKKDEESEETCGSKCSDSEEETSQTSQPILDLEDIAKLL